MGVDARGRVAIALAVVVIGVHLAQPTGLLGEATFLSFSVVAAIGAWVVARRRPGSQRPWRLVAAGIALSACGDVIESAITLLHGEVPEISIADAFWLGSYVFLILGLVVLHGEHRRSLDLDGLIDMGAVGVVGLLVMWQFAIEPTISDTSTGVFTRAVWAAYPILDAALVALVVRALVSRRARSSTGIVLAAGIACWLVSDFAYALLPEARVPSGLLDTGWMAGTALLAVAVGRTPLQQQVHARAADDEMVTVARVALGIAPLLAPGLIECGAALRGGTAHPIPGLIATTALALLAFARGARLARAADVARTSLANSERYYRTLAMNSSDAVILLDDQGTITNDSPALARLLGYDGETTVGASSTELVNPDDLDRVLALFQTVLEAPLQVFEIELRLRHARGFDVWLSGRITNLLGDPDLNAVVVTMQDISARKQAEAELAHQAFHDSLTGLANRSLFRDRVEHALDQSARSGLVPTVVFVDLDGFKDVNDSLGHEVGDELLCNVARRFLQVVRAGDTVARLGGDEFGVLLQPSETPIEDARMVVDRLLETLTMPVQVGGSAVSIGASAGVAPGGPGATASSLLRDADTAMYRAKVIGKGAAVVYEPAMRKNAIERIRLAADLAKALHRRQLRLEYQPVMDLAHDSVIGFEALCRWDHPELGTIQPDRFIPLAEETGQIIRIGRWVLQQACAQLAAWRAAGHESLQISVNISPRHLASGDLLVDVMEALAYAGLPGSALVVELTESALVTDPELAAARLRELRDLGVRLAIDDFGTGYSSLSYLPQFPLDILKVDRSFIETIGEDGNAHPIVRGLLDLGHTLGMRIVAEGIEHQAQRDWLVAHGCRLGQGFLFSRPLDTETATRFLLRSLVSS